MEIKIYSAHPYFCLYPTLGMSPGGLCALCSRRENYEQWSQTPNTPPVVRSPNTAPAYRGPCY